ncbi:zinc ABC transporter ATP-binding protein AztA [Bosea sp. (in: a-proteobacteria)]|uniref:zinc ABC transporter ATP-binding protein AztA n=1 Tax=Bosea sp. (in: a-proteobacteria) TaxID=1871050 RepID=UPI002632CBA5|nr:zinc ABC transporter ATP-binding protein AztA [Bosea sp. (in: a-proteobacteria)]MCO5090065.1 ABC transporter ATP-binding protein [Bosea sp. (in: a-proteobacteria)]
MPAIRLTDLTLGYDRHPAVHHLSGGIEAGSLTAVVGPNGAGKSTLLKGIAGALSPLSGSIALGRGQRLAYLPQSADLDRSFPIHVYDLVAMGLWNRAGIFGRIGAAHKIEHAIAAVGLTGFERRPIGTLSGGQMQRALFARLLLQDADVILLDEPFTAIDARTTADLLELVRRWHGENRTVIAVLHDIETVRQAFPQTLLLAREAIAWGETGAVLTPENLLKARRMVEAFDGHAAPCRREAA